MLAVTQRNPPFAVVRQNVRGGPRPSHAFQGSVFWVTAQFPSVPDCPPVTSFIPNPPTYLLAHPSLWYVSTLHLSAHPLIHGSMRACGPRPPLRSSARSASQDLKPRFHQSRLHGGGEEVRGDGGDGTVTFVAIRLSNWLSCGELTHPLRVGLGAPRLRP